jgi:hypothetical protein
MMEISVAMFVGFAMSDPVNLMMIIIISLIFYPANWLKRRRERKDCILDR